MAKTYWRFGISQQPHRISHRTFYFKWLSSHSLRYSASGYVPSSSTIWIKHETVLCPFGWLFHSPSPHTQSCLRLSTSLEPVDPSFPVNGALELNSTFFTLYATLKSSLPPAFDRGERKRKTNMGFSTVRHSAILASYLNSVSQPPPNPVIRSTPMKQ